MQKIFNLTSNIKSVEEADDGSVNIKGYASTNDTDRAGDVIKKEAWEKGGLDNFGNNPIILFNHDYNKPIGRATSLETDDKGLKITANLSKSAGDITNLVKEGILRAFSVGFRVKDADYMEDGDGYLIKDAELFEVSVVSVPANQAATFSVAKSFDTKEEYSEWKKQFVKTTEVITPQDNTDNMSVFKEKIMSENKDFNLEEFAKNVAKETTAAIAMQQADAKAKAIAEDQAVAEKAVEEKAISDAKLEEKKAEVSAIIEAGTSGAETLVSDLEKRIDNKYSNVEEVVEGLRAELREKSEEISQIRESKRIFGERQKGGNVLESFASDLEDVWLLGKATGKGLNTKFAQDTMQKVNTMSGVDVSSADFEQTVSTNIERDIQNELVLAPLFREIAMTSATQILPILPDSGYAEFTANQAATGSSPHGNLDMRSATYADRAGVVMTERTLSTKKLISQSYLGNETEEDAILPILPLIRESMIRSHARGMENAVLAGDDADGVYGTSGATFEGLLHLARNDSDLTQTATAFASDALTALQLLAARKNMGKYGLRAEDVIYVVSQRGYFELLEDAEFQDVNLVGDMATKLSGEIGTVFGSKVIVCDEFATPAVSKFHAVAVYARNYVMPRLRGMTVESDYEVANQRRVLVASQRIGFIDLIDGATSKWALQYKAS
jgi:HK97 family phage prohead protease|tara:strand:+ start:6194 stop:8206 length:2013 start_codon:yes stop_codon:yes gene_type:complete